MNYKLEETWPEHFQICSRCGKISHGDNLYTGEYQENPFKCPSNNPRSRLEPCGLIEGKQVWACDQEGMQFYYVSTTDDVQNLPLAILIDIADGKESFEIIADMRNKGIWPEDDVVAGQLQKF